MLRPAALLVATLLLAGCMPVEPTVAPVPEPSATPAFASDEEALAAATDAYAKYLEVSDAITANGGVGVEEVSRLVTAEQYPKEVASFSAYSDRNLHTSGASVSEVFGLQSFSTGVGNDDTSIVIYVCVDVTGVAILNDSNEDVTPLNSPNRYPLEVEFASESSTPPGLKIARSETWSGTDFCQP